MLRAVRNKVDKNKNAAPPLDRMSRSFLHPNYLSLINTSNYSVFLLTTGATCPGYLVYIGWNNLVEHGMHPHLNACIGLYIIGFTFRWNFIWGTAVKNLFWELDMIYRLVLLLLWIHKDQNWFHLSCCKVREIRISFLLNFSELIPYSQKLDWLKWVLWWKNAKGYWL